MQPFQILFPRADIDIALMLEAEAGSLEAAGAPVAMIKDRDMGLYPFLVHQPR